MADTLLGILEKTTDARECMAAQKQLEQAAQAKQGEKQVEIKSDTAIKPIIKNACFCICCLVPII